MAVRGYIFDYGGTLDTGGCHWGKTFWHAYERTGAPVGWMQFREAYIHTERYLGSHEVITPQHTFRQTLQTKLDVQTDYLCNNGDWHQDERQRGDICRRLYDDLYNEVIRQTAFSRQVLNRLSESYPLALVSNFYGNMPTVLREFGLDTLFRTVVESAEVGIRKPDPQIFRLGVEALGLPPGEVTVVGDSIKKDILPAKAIGCRTVWLQGEGWDDHPGDTTAPDRIITRLDQLLESPDESR